MEFGSASLPEIEPKGSFYPQPLAQLQIQVKCMKHGYI